MSKTKRKYHDGMCLRGMQNKPHKQEKSKMIYMVKDEKITINNRPVTKSTPEPYDDVTISALSETKHIWKHIKVVIESDDTLSVFNKTNFLVNLSRDELKLFDWKHYFPKFQKAITF